MRKIFFIANNNIGDSGLSGGDRICVELAKRWRTKTEVVFVATEEAITIYKKNGLGELLFYKTSDKVDQKDVFSLKAIFCNFFKKLFNGVCFVIKNEQIFKDKAFVYSISDFYPDSIPAFLIKLMNPDSIWIAGFYLFASPPWQKNSPYKGKNALRGFLYWLSQQPVYWIVRSWADIVFVTSEPDRVKFITKKRGASKVIVVRGGVDIEEAKRYAQTQSINDMNQKIYDGCFIGRFHLQKGVLVLVDIWKEVLKLRPSAKLAMIGNGPLEGEVRRKAIELGIMDHLKLFGFLDYQKKFDVFKQSKIVLHPATFDSGGMAAAEAMAWGLPGIGFDLEALKTYYNRGMIKVPLLDIKCFAQEIVRLLSDKNHFENVAKEARDFIFQEWNWEKRADCVFDQLLRSCPDGIM